MARSEDMEQRQIIEARRQAFVAWMQRMGITQAEVSRRTGIPKTTLSSYVNGQSSSLLGTNQEKIARAFATSPDVIFNLQSKSGTIGVFGFLGAGLMVNPVISYDDAPIREVGHDMIIDPAMRYVAFEIVGHPIPAVEPGWLAICCRADGTPPADYVGHICVVDTVDGERLMRRLRQGYTEGCFNLESLDGSPVMEDVCLTRAVRLVGYREPAGLLTDHANAA